MKVKLKTYNIYVFSQDYINSKKLVINKGIIIFDVHNMSHIQKIIDRKIKDNEIIELNDENIIMPLFITNFVLFIHK